MLTIESFPSDAIPDRCDDPLCGKIHNETYDEDELLHHYGCECSQCLFEYWKMKCL